MTDEQGANEIKYRVASLLLLSLLDRSLISVWLLGEICGIEKAAHEKRQSNVKPMVAEKCEQHSFLCRNALFRRPDPDHSGAVLYGECVG